MTMNKQDFPLLTKQAELIYFDNAATAQKPQAVISALSDYYTKTNANVHRGIYDLSEQATVAYEAARVTVANFIGANSDEIIFTSGTTEGLNLLASYYFPEKIQAGDAIVVSEMEHHSNLLPWQRLAKQTGAKLLFIDTLPDYTLNLEQLDNYLANEKVKLVALTQMSNVLGTINPITQIAKKIHDINPEIVLIVDAAQSIAHLNIDVTELDCDFLVASGHKLFGPTGIGFIYGKQKHLETAEAFFLGGGMIEQVTREDATWEAIPTRFEAGTPNISGAIGLAAAIKYFSSLDIPALQAHEQELTALMFNSLKGIPEVKLFGPEDLSKRGPVFAFTVAGIHPHDLAQLLNEKHIAIRAGHHCTQILHRERLQIPASARASLAFYNEEAEIEKFFQELKSIISSNMFKH